ncbi:hypothetical protein PG990_004298 [Apiospora arundinis]
MKRKSNKCKGAAQPEPVPAVDDDPRPTSSPYTTPIVNVCFGNTHEVFKVPKALLDKCSNLPSRGTYSNEYRFECIPKNVGHILIHFLFTDTYQSLKPQGSTLCEMQATEFATCVQAYSVAQTHELPSLAKLAQREIWRLSESVDMSTVLAALSTAYPNGIVDDVFLSGYLKSRMETLFADRVAMRAVTSTPDDVSRAKSIAELLFESTVKLRLEDTEQEYDERDEVRETASPEARDCPEYPHDEELDENRGETVFSPVLEEPCPAEAVWPSGPPAEPEWVGASDQDSDAIRDTPTSESVVEAKPDDFMGYEAPPIVEEEPKMEFDCVPSPKSEDRKKKKKAATGWMFYQVPDECWKWKAKGANIGGLDS